MSETKVVVEGGGANLYVVKDSAGAFHAYKDEVWGSGKHIGTAASMNDALVIIARHSGKKIKRIG